MTYSQKLKDPRWQKKRLEVMEMAEWKCYSCGGSERPLHVHHVNYFKGLDPWDYENDNLRSLCDLCHGRLESAIVYSRAGLSKMPSNASRQLSIAVLYAASAFKRIGFSGGDNPPIEILALASHLVGAVQDVESDLMPGFGPRQLMEHAINAVSNRSYR